MVKGVNYLSLAIYLLANLYLTMLSRTPKVKQKMKLDVFWSYRAAFAGNTALGEKVILNILLYIPLGYLMHYAFSRLRWWWVIACGIALSAMTEAVQLAFRLVKRKNKYNVCANRAERRKYHAVMKPGILQIDMM